MEQVEKDHDSLSRRFSHRLRQNDLRRGLVQQGRSGPGYPGMIASRLLCDRSDVERIFYDRGISGNRIVDLYARWKVDGLNLGSDLISILIGVIVSVKFCKLKKSNIFSFSPLLMCSSTELLTVGVPPPTS